MIEIATERLTPKKLRFYDKNKLINLIWGNKKIDVIIKKINEILRFDLSQSITNDIKLYTA